MTNKQEWLTTALKNDNFYPVLWYRMTEETSVSFKWEVKKLNGCYMFDIDAKIMHNDKIVEVIDFDHISSRSHFVDKRTFLIDFTSPTEVRKYLKTTIEV